MGGLRMNKKGIQKLISIFNNKLLLVFVLIGVIFTFMGCMGRDDPQKVFMEELTKSTSYKVEGIMESFYDNNGRKRNEFSVYYKTPDLIKVIIKSEDKNDKQIILKNEDGVYILIPAVNKNFKIQSNWPANASYPYLLQSLAKDIANDPEAIITEDDKTLTVETKTKMHTDATPVKQKIIFDKLTNLPTEVLIYDENENVYIRTVFTNIDLKYNVSDDEFDLNNSMATVRLEIKDTVNYENREIAYPKYCPEGFTLASENTKKSIDGTEVLSIMKYGSDTGFTIVQEFVNDTDVTKYQEETGQVILVLNNITILKAKSLQTVYEGIEYTIASQDLGVTEMIKIVQGYMINEDTK